MKHALVAVSLFVLTLLAYSNSFHSGFVLDNRPLIIEDLRIRDASWSNIDLIFHHTYWWPFDHGLYRPITTLSYLFNYAVMGNANQPAGYHWINFFLHFLNVVLVYALVLRLARKFWLAVFVAAIWAVHPLLTESVTNIIGRADLLAAAAVLSGLLMYLKSAIQWLAPVRMACGAGGRHKRGSIFKRKLGRNSGCHPVVRVSVLERMERDQRKAPRTYVRMRSRRDSHRGHVVSAGNRHGLLASSRSCLRG